MMIETYLLIAVVRDKQFIKRLNRETNLHKVLKYAPRRWRNVGGLKDDAAMFSLPWGQC